MKSKRFTLVEEVLDIDADRFWFYIPGYNGYEISNDGIIRSMKHYKKYPFGMLIQPKKDRDGNIIHPEDPIFELSNNHNERESLHRSEIRRLAETNPYQITGYPRRTRILDIAPRNQRCFIKKQIQKQPFDNTIIHPKFTIISDEPETELKLGKTIPNVVCPIQSINGGEYYGRKDCGAFRH